ncbi:MAG: BatD family protein [Candidatus Zapsychrus exili]|nr:BatD family protein [Candidatus Zapsychrus exili]
MTKNVNKILIFLIVVFSAVVCLAQDISFEVTVDRNKTTLDSVVTLSLTLNGATSDALGLPEINGFQSRYLGPSTQVTVVNGNYSKITTHNYSLYPTEIGIFTIPSMSIKIEGEIYTSESIKIEVIDSSKAQVPKSSQSSGKTGLEDKILLTLDVPKRDIYLYEKVPVTVKLYIQGFTARDIEFPKFDSLGLTFEDYKQPNQYTQVIDGIRFDVIEFNTKMYSIREGRLEFGPARLGFNILYQGKRRSSSDSFFGSFFDRYEKRPVEVRSEGYVLNVLPLPGDEKPEDFSGGVGQFDFDVVASPGMVKVGDPITIIMKVSGQGDLSAINMPYFKDDDNFKTYDPQIRQERNVKILEQVLIPKSENATKIPIARFSYFDSNLKQYRSIVRGPFDLTILPSEEGDEFRIVGLPRLSGAIAVEDLGRDIIYIKGKPGKFLSVGYLFSESFSFKSILVLITIIFIALLLYRLRRNRFKTDIAFARRTQAPKKARELMKEAKKKMNDQKTLECYDCVFKTITEYFGDKFHISAAGMTFSDLKKILNDKGVDENVINRLEKLFKECDEVRFAAANQDLELVKGNLKACEEIIDYFERNFR